MRPDLRFLLGLVAFGCMAVLVTGRAHAAPLGASFGNAGHFPARALVVSAPASKPLIPSTVHVEENGQAVRSVSVTRLAVAKQGTFGVILAIDTSESMRGAPLRQAMIAARSLAAERASNEELGVIEFGHAVSATLPPTVDQAAIDAALAQTPKVGFGTPIDAAALEGIRELHNANVAAGTVIVLSDGGAFGPDATRQEVASAASADDVHIYTVGLKDAAFSGSLLTGLAHATGGNYTASDLAGLRRVFTNIESQLTDRYLVRYRSRQGAGQAVHVRLWVNGVSGPWTGSYVTPAAPPHARLSAPARSHARLGFWGSGLALVLLAGVSAVLLVGGLLFHYVPRTRETELRARIGEFTRTEAPEPLEDQPGSTLRDRADTWLGQFAWWPRFKEEVEIAGIERTAVDVLFMTLSGTLFAAIAVSLLAGTALVSLPVMMIGPAAMLTIVRHRAGRQRRAFGEELPAQLEEIGSAMRAGHSIAASIASMTERAVDPARREFERAVADERLGVPLDAALRPIARRMRSSDIDQLGLVASLNQRTGGNMAEVLDAIAAGARERLDLRRELRALTAQARLSRWIVSALPPALLAILAVIQPSYIRPLFETTGGVIVLSLATLLVLGGSFVMRLLVPNEE